MTASAAEPGPLHILIADDSLITHTIGRAILRKAGHTVDVVDNGREAVTAVRDQAFDLVLMDIQMPELDGVGATRAIRTLPEPNRRIPIIALTVNSTPEQLAGYRSVGMDGYIVKPFTSGSMMSEIRRVLSPGASQPNAPNAPGPASIPKESESTHWHDLGIFDDGQMASLRECLGQEGFRDLLGNISAALAPEVDAIKSALNRGAFEEVSGLAQRLRGDAAIVGAQRVARFAKFLSRKIDTDKVPGVVEDMEAIYQETLADLRSRRWT